jgi:hypothetical protein
MARKKTYRVRFYSIADFDGNRVDFGEEDIEILEVEPA